MITATQNVIDEIISPVRDIHARVELYQGSTLVETCNCNDRLIKFDVQRIGDTSKFFGFGICHRINIHLIDGQRTLDLNTSYSIKVAYRVDDELVYPYPIFYISQVRRDENTNELSITGYDLMYPDTAHVVSDMELPENYSYLYFASAAVKALGATALSLGNITDMQLFMTEFKGGANFEGTETIREALNDLAEATQSIYYINNKNELVLTRLDKSGSAKFTITKSDYITLESRPNKRLGAIYHVTELGDNLHATTTTTGSSQYVRDNAFWTRMTSTEIAAQLTKAIEAVGGLTISQFDCSWRGNFLLEIGDKINIVNKDDSLSTTYILDDTIEYNGALTERTSWSYFDNDDETESNPVTLGDKLNQTFAKVDKVNREIELLASKFEDSDVGTLTEEVAQLKITTESISQEVSSIKTTVNGDIEAIEKDVSSIKLTNDSITQRVSALEQNSEAGEIGKLKEEVAELKITTEGITQEVSRVEQVTSDSIQTISNIVSNSVSAEDVKILIKQEVKEGIDVDANSVTTETGYVFNKDGLTVSKSGSELSTQITEDGMTVKRNDETVLSADSDGVYATNLHATTYLIIGETSRFEDYEDSSLGTRTGCFWIGR